MRNPTGQTVAIWNRPVLKAFSPDPVFGGARQRLPMLGEITHRWSGQIMEPVDALPYAGRNPLDSENSFVITGDSGSGPTNATMGAEAVTDLMRGRENPYSELYSPGRIKLASSIDYVK